MKFHVFAALALASLARLAPAHAGSLPDPAVKALQLGLADERNAEAFYAAVMDKFGAVRPFSNIIKAEQRHEAMLLDLFQRYDVAVPGLPTGGVVPSVPPRLAEACQMGIDAEIANRDLYDKQLLPAVANYPDITQVFTALRDASEQNHLPAFRRCVNGANAGQRTNSQRGVRAA